jgi:phosphatidylserine/phosphatidylglycerophosphate/cardiolipin synthase-like enzyme
MHHKVFLIDILSPRCTIITGSFNPTASGDKRNDENVLIIKNNQELCKLYYEEFERMYAKGIEKITSGS